MELASGLRPGKINECLRWPVGEAALPHDGEGRGTNRSRSGDGRALFTVHVPIHFFFLYALFMVAGKLGLGLPPFWIMGLLCMVATYLAAWISFTWFEAPLMVYGRRLEGRTAATARRV